MIAKSQKNKIMMPMKNKKLNNSKSKQSILFHNVWINHGSLDRTVWTSFQKLYAKTELNWIRAIDLFWVIAEWDMLFPLPTPEHEASIMYTSKGKWWFLFEIKLLQNKSQFYCQIPFDHNVNFGLQSQRLVSFWFVTAFASNPYIMHGRKIPLT